MIKILFICHGNICRSTMAQSILTHLVNQRGLSTKFYIESAATSREEIGNPPHYGTVTKLKNQKILVIPHRARQMTAEDYQNYDYLIGMDEANIRNMTRIAGGDPEAKIYKMMYFAVANKNKNKNVADPWYTGDFDETFNDIIEGCEGLLNYLFEEGELS